MMALSEDLAANLVALAEFHGASFSVDAQVAARVGIAIVTALEDLIVAVEDLAAEVRSR
jgi:hypothetical protein